MPSSLVKLADNLSTMSHTEKLKQRITTFSADVLRRKGIFLLLDSSKKSLYLLNNTPEMTSPTKRTLIMNTNMRIKLGMSLGVGTLGNTCLLT